MTKPILIAPRSEDSINGGEPKVPKVVKTSKSWVVPPKRKPGPKTHISPPAEKSKLEKELQRSQTMMDQLKKEYDDLRNKYESSIRSTVPAAKDPVKQHEQDCGLCEEGGGCVCDDLGLKPKNARIDPSEPAMNFENFERMEAVPLPKRKNPAGEGATVRKYKRLNDGAPKELDMTPDYKGSSSTENDSCGFCSKDTPCLCAETATTAHTHAQAPASAPPVTPNVPGASSVGAGTSSNGASRKFMPGSCAACQSDPMRMLFCTGLVSNNDQSKQSTFKANISCSDAYETLSRHKKFNDIDMSDVVTKLETDGNGKVSVSSMSKVLKYMNTL